MESQNFKNHPGVAAVLSFVFSGIGQIYNGQIRKGLIHVSLATLGVLLVMIGAIILGVGVYSGYLSIKSGAIGLVFMLGGGFVVCWIGVVSIYDAYNNADAHRS